MEYSEGYLAFIDILGFSKYVSNNANCEKIYDFFDFIKKFCYLFNSSPELEVQASFFSDTIVITAKKLDKLLIPIYIAESYLKNNLELLFRGSIVYGKYYHKDETTFGPAVVSGYALENKAVYSRILLDENICVPYEASIFHFTDIDGYRCLNPFGMVFTEILSSAPERIVYPESIDDELENVFSTKRTELLKQIKQHRGTPVVDKYLWRVRPYNYTCNYVLSIPPNEVIYKDIGYSINDKLKEKISKLIISENDVLA